MKKLIVFLILSTVLSCGKVNTSPAYVKILKPTDGAVFEVGDTVEIDAQVVVLQKNAERTTYLIIDGNTTIDLNAFPGRPYDWVTDDLEVGEHFIKVRIIEGGQESGSDEITIILKHRTSL